MARRMMRKRSRRTSRRRGGFKRFARKVYRAVRYKAEKKQTLNYSGVVDVQAGTDAVFTNLTLCSAGADSTQRVGTKIRGRFIKIKMVMSSNGSQAIVMRVSVVRGRTAALGIADAPTANLVTLWDKDRWEIIYDKSFAFNDLIAGTTSNVPIQKTWNKSIRCNREMIFDNATANSQITNPYFLYISSNDSVIPSPVAEYSWAFSFSDL